MKASIETNATFSQTVSAKLSDRIQKLDREVDDIRDETNTFDSIVKVKTDELKDDIESKLN